MVSAKNKNSGKKVKANIKLQIPAGSANPAPPIGPALGSNGIAIAPFCKEFNDATASLQKGALLSVKITVYEDKTYSFRVLGPSTTYLIKKALDIKIASKNPGKEFVDKELNSDQIDSIVNEKIKYMNCISKDAAFEMVAGSARSMGIKVNRNK